MRSYDVIVVGGGMIGCATAAQLAARGLTVVVLEARKGSVQRFSGELIHPPGAMVLEEMGLLDELKAAGGVDVSGFNVGDVPEAPGVRSLLPYSDIPAVRPAGFAIHHPTMVDALRAVLARR